MIPDVTPNGVFYLPPTGWLTSFYNPPFITVLDTKKLSECTTNDIVDSAEISKKLSTTITKINKIFSMKLKMIYWEV